MEASDSFGRIRYFLVHRYDGIDFELALVQLTNKVDEKDFGLLESAAGWSRLMIVDVSCIKQVAGYIVRGNKWYHIV
jgi:hypothetical protein